ncbi:hypothetical protein ACQEVZ_20270 [Dactylosporangium sp. CA-152071]|uniref:hypothetical protein n=1 Tax=Dactylosporangium sp. CA-152071 TaxID=3239933 RepID=UPI003D8B083C
MTWAEFCALYIPAPATIAVEAYEGSGGRGDLYAAAAAVTPCVVEDTRRLVRVQTQDAAGAEQVSSTTVYAPLGTVAPPKSRVTLPSGRVAQVLAVSDITAAGHDLPEYVELNLE